MLDDKTSQPAVARLVAPATSPNHVILFGSYARGTTDEPERAANDRIERGTPHCLMTKTLLSVHQVVDLGYEDRDVSILLVRRSVAYGHGRPYHIRLRTDPIGAAQ